MLRCNNITPLAEGHWKICCPRVVERSSRPDISVTQYNFSYMICNPSYGVWRGGDDILPSPFGGSTVRASIVHWHCHAVPCLQRFRSRSAGASLARDARAASAPAWNVYPSLPALPAGPGPDPGPPTSTNPPYASRPLPLPTCLPVNPPPPVVLSFFLVAMWQQSQSVRISQSVSQGRIGEEATSPSLPFILHSLALLLLLPPVATIAHDVMSRTLVRQQYILTVLMMRTEPPNHAGVLGYVGEKLHKRIRVYNFT